MYMWDGKSFRPPQETLAQYHRILIGDEKYRIPDMVHWARTHCESFAWYEVNDVSDFNLSRDEIAVFYFGDPADVTVFELKFR